MANLLTVALTIALFARFFAGQLDPFDWLFDRLLCEVTIEETVPSPEGGYTAVVFHKDCGATTSYNTQIAITPAGAPFADRLFPAFLVIGGLHHLLVTWGSDSHLIVRLPSGERVYRQNHESGGVAITYMH